MRLKYLYIFILLIGIIPQASVIAQDSLVEQQKGYNSKKHKKFNSNSLVIQKSSKSNDEIMMAKNYEETAKFFSEKGEYVKAEEELKKALTIYSKRKMMEDKARVSRSLAKVQEQQGKTQEAITSYQQAGSESRDKE